MGNLKKKLLQAEKKRSAIPTDYQPSSKCGKSIHNVENHQVQICRGHLHDNFSKSFVARDPRSKIWQNLRPTLDPPTRISTQMCSKGPSTSNIWTPSPSIWSNNLGIIRPDPSHHSSDVAFQPVATYVIHHVFPIWRCPKIGVPLVILHLNRLFHV